MKAPISTFGIVSFLITVLSLMMTCTVQAQDTLTVEQVVTAAEANPALAVQTAQQNPAAAAAIAAAVPDQAVAIAQAVPSQAAAIAAAVPDQAIAIAQAVPEAAQEIAQITEQSSDQDSTVTTQGNGGVFTVRDSDGNLVTRVVVTEEDVLTVAAQLRSQFPGIYNNDQFTASPN